MRFLTSIVTFGVIVAPAIACAGGPTSPSTTPSPSPIATLTFVSGADNAPVAGATINVAGNPPLVTDTAGQVALPNPVAIGAALDATANGFLPRLSQVVSSEAMTLWPVGPNYTEAFFREIVYRDPVAPILLTRPTSGTTYLVMSPDVVSEQAAIEDAATKATAVSEGKVVYVVTTQAPAGARAYNVRLNPNQFDACVASSNRRGNMLIGGTISCAGLVQLRMFIAHEVGHTLGLGHDNNTIQGLMCSVPRSSDYTVGERMAVRMMSQRNPGTEAPDNDRNTTAASRYPAEVTVSMDGDEPVITIHNRSDQSLRDLTITARLEGAFAVNAQTRAAGQVISYLPVSMSGAIRVPAQQRFSGDSGTITVQVTDASGRLVAEPSGIITVACGH